MEWITSRHNALCMHLRKLASERKYRREQRCFLCEGTKLVREAVQWGAALDAVVCAEGVKPPEGLSADVRQISMPGELFQNLSTMDTPQGMMAVCHMPDLTPPKSILPGGYLVLDGVQDPGNVGTIWRTADALGAAGLLMVNCCADPFSPKTVRATMGACFRLPVWEMELDTLKATLTEVGVPLYATALQSDTIDIRQVSVQNAAVIIGSEGQGVSDHALELCEQTLQIPMRERCESLNAATAATVVLWEMARKSL